MRQVWSQVLLGLQVGRGGGSETGVVTRVAGFTGGERGGSETGVVARVAGFTGRERGWK